MQGPRGLPSQILQIASAHKEEKEKMLLPFMFRIMKNGSCGLCLGLEPEIGDFALLFKDLFL